MGAWDPDHHPARQVLDAGGASRVLEVSTQATAILRGIGLTNGRARVGGCCDALHARALSPALTAHSKNREQGPTNGALRDPLGYSTICNTKLEIEIG